MTGMTGGLVCFSLQANDDTFHSMSCEVGPTIEGWSKSRPRVVTSEAHYGERANDSAWMRDAERCSTC